MTQSSRDRRAFIGRLTKGAIALCALDLAHPLLRYRNSTRDVLSFANPRKCLYGALVTPEELPLTGELAAAACDVVVMAAGVFWGSLERHRYAKEWRRAEIIEEFAARLGKVVRGHTLVSHSDLPAWLPGALATGDGEAILTERVFSVMRHFAGKIAYWDVLNEVVSVADGQEDALRNSIWRQRLGRSYIHTALRAARQADPTARLGYNEYGIEDDSRQADLKRESVLRLLREIKNAGTPLDYLGVQAHLAPSQSFSTERLGKFLGQVRSLGLEILITELDVNDQSLPGDAVTRDSEIAQTYHRFLSVVLSSVTPRMVTTWGLSDRFTWQQREHPRRDRLEQRSLPFDACLRPKPAWRELVNMGIAPEVKSSCRDRQHELSNESSCGCGNLRWERV